MSRDVALCGALTIQVRFNVVTMHMYYFCVFCLSAEAIIAAGPGLRMSICMSFTQIQEAVYDSKTWRISIINYLAALYTRTHVSAGDVYRDRATSLAAITAGNALNITQDNSHEITLWNIDALVIELRAMKCQRRRQQFANEPCDAFAHRTINSQAIAHY